MTSILHREWRRLLCGGMVLALAGCGAMPAAGPTTRDVTENAGPRAGYAVVPLTASVLGTLDAVKPPSLADTFGNAEPAIERRLSVGDTVAVTIWDAGGGLFSPGEVMMAGSSMRPGTQTTVLPAQMIDSKGNISVPFAGQLHVAGNTTFQAQEKIQRSLAAQTLKPQALVSVVTDQGNLATVIGDVKNPGRIPISPAGSRTLDAIAMTGGTLSPAFDTLVQLTRGGQTKRVRLSSVLERPDDNIYLKPSDVLYLLREPKAVSILGAIKTNSRIEFATERLTLAEALSQAGGLVDAQSEPAGVFVFRMEPANVAAALNSQVAASSDANAAVPVVFRADLRHTEGFFLAQSFQLQDKDIVYVPDTETTQIDKVLRIILHAAGIAGVLTNKNGLSLGE